MPLLLLPEAERRAGADKPVRELNDDLAMPLLLSLEAKIQEDADKLVAVRRASALLPRSLKFRCRVTQSMRHTNPSGIEGRTPEHLPR